MKHNVLLMLGLIFLSPALAAAEPTALVRSISVTGEAKEELAPDQAVISGQLVSRDKQLAAAKKDNDNLMARLVAVAKQFEIPKEKISASNVFISPEYTYNDKLKKQELTGYVVSRNLSMTLDKMDIHERVLSALVENKIDQVNGVSFGLSNPEKRRDALRVIAVQNAKARAQSLADAAGAKLGKVISITTNGASPPPMPVPMMMAAKARMAEDSVAPSLPGLTSLQESVSVTYELE